MREAACSGRSGGKAWEDHERAAFAELAFHDHVCHLNSTQSCRCCGECLETHQRPDPSLDAAMVLFDNAIEILRLIDPDPAWRTDLLERGIHALQTRSVCAAHFDHARVCHRTTFGVKAGYMTGDVGTTTRSARDMSNHVAYLVELLNQ